MCNLKRSSLPSDPCLVVPAQCVLEKPPSKTPTQCALICKANDEEHGMTRLDGSVCPAGASCKPISTTAICTYNDGGGPTPPSPPGPNPPPPPPPPGPTPPSPPGPHYGDPLTGPCTGGDKNVTITGVRNLCPRPTLPCPVF